MDKWTRLIGHPRFTIIARFTALTILESRFTILDDRFIASSILRFSTLNDRFPASNSST
jgi:hypothetical protein